MSNRPVVTVVLAGVLIAAVLGVTALMTFGSLANRAKFAEQEIWSKPLADIQSMKIIDLTGDGQADLFLQGLSAVTVLDANGEPYFAQDFLSPVTTLGDVNGDQVEDIVVFDGTGVTALTGTGQTLWGVQPALRPLDCGQTALASPASAVVH